MDQFPTIRIFAHLLLRCVKCRFQALFIHDRCNIITYLCDLIIREFLLKAEKRIDVRIEETRQRGQYCDIRITAASLPLIDRRSGNPETLCYLFLCEPQFFSLPAYHFTDRHICILLFPVMHILFYKYSFCTHYNSLQIRLTTEPFSHIWAKS